MYMNDEQKYNAVIKELGELLQGKNTTISCYKWQIAELKEKLKVAENKRKEAEARAMELDTQLLEAESIIEQLKGGAAQC